jgi:FAD dependent oxidoreductase
MNKKLMVLFKKIKIISLTLIIILSQYSCEVDQQVEEEYDIVIYGGTSSGIAAAIQSARLNKSVALIVPGKHLGGLTSGGLGQTDIGNKNVIGGIAKEFYQRVYLYYSKDESWIYQNKNQYKTRTEEWDKDSSWWQFEPHVAESILNSMLAEIDVSVFFNERLDLKDGVRKDKNRIYQISLESGKNFRGKIFIDATYEGDLLAKSGVSYTVGREPNSQYGESLNGVQTANAIYHQFMDNVDPYIEKGNSKSGLLPMIDPNGPGEEGIGDSKIQAYCFRMCLTDARENQVPFTKPSGYDSLQYELLFRNYEAGEDKLPLITGRLPNRKTDSNNKRGFSTDYIGQNYDYAEADYITRKKIFNSHLSYQKGLMWTLANHPRVPLKIREEVNRWGLAKDEFVETDHWSHQLYIREARRMISDYVMSEKNCRGDITVDNSIGMAAYTMDSHHVQRYVNDSGHVQNEGDVEVGGFPPYPISYNSIIPKDEECSNLLVPVCLSASHIAFGSIRMEPVFMVLGQSAAIAASVAINESISLKEINYQNLRGRLIAAGQVLELEKN